MDGKGLAVTGLVTGYLSIASLFIVIPVIAGLAVPVFAKVQENGQISKEIHEAREVFFSIEIYKSENDGIYPESLQELVDNYELSPHLITEHALAAQNPGGQRFSYLKPTADTGGDARLLISNRSYSGSRRVVTSLNGAVQTERFPEDSTQ